jgi:hypothetical protein
MQATPQQHVLSAGTHKFILGHRCHHGDDVTLAVLLFPYQNSFVACCADDLPSSDAAARTLWLLVKDNKRLLSPAKGALGVPGTQLIDALLTLVEAREDQEDAEDAEDEAGAGDADGDEDEDGDAVGQDAGKVAVEFGDEAMLLLRGLAAQDGGVKEQLAGQSEILGSRCTIM